MKRLAAAICLLLFALSISFWGHWKLNKTCDELIVELYDCVEIAQNGDEQEIAERGEYLNKWWDKNHTVLSVLVNHSALDTMQSFLPTLRELAEMGDTEELIENCYECINMTEDLKMNEEISVGNIF